MSVYSDLEDKELVFKVNELFYEKMFEHDWLKLFFQEVDQKLITQQQTDFIVAAIGGPKNYCGRVPSTAHPHIMVTDEIFELREQVLKDAMDVLNAPQALKDIWLKIDYSFKSNIVKNSVSECEKRNKIDVILDFKDPRKQAA